MRPLRLTLEGLRSYKAQRTVDFSDKTLLAIVGDTGTGKSSLLEAITYALYSAATWSGHAGELIADGAKTMRVELEFEAGGQRWKVTRSMSRDAYPLPVHKLECLDTGERVNGKGEVNARVVRLVGLDSKAFLQAVVLPQGRFAELLKATATERGKILQNIFRVDEILAARELAERHLARWRPRHGAWVERRRDYPADPGAEAQEAEEEGQRAAAREARLAGLAQTIGDLERAAGQAEEQARRLEGTAAEVADTDLLGFAADLETVREAAAALRARREELEREQAGAREAETSARATLAAAAAEGVGLEVLNRAEAALEGLAGDLVHLGEAAGEAASDAAEMDAQGHRVEERWARAKASAQLEAEAARAAAFAADRAQAAKQGLDAARQALAEAQRRATERATVESERQRLAEEIGKAKTAATGLREREGAAKAAADDARHHLEAARRHAAAAVAARDCAPGDDCPVCARPLPTGWSPPAAPELEASRRAADRARDDHEKAQQAATKAEAHLEGLRRRQGELAEALREAEAACEGAIARLGHALDLGPSETGSRLGEGEGLLGGLAAAVRVVEDEARRAVGEARRLLQQATEDKARAESSATELARAKERHAKRASALSTQLGAVRENVSRLPAAVRPAAAGVGSVDLALGPEERRAALGLPAVAEAQAEVSRRLGALRALVEAAQAAGTRAKDLDRELAGLQRQERAQVEDPVREALARASRLVDRLGRASGLLDLPAPPPPPAGAEPVVLADWAAQLEETAGHAAAALAASATAARGQAEERRKEASAQLAETGLDDGTALDEELLGARLAVARCAEAHQRALGQIPVVQELDDRIGRGGELLATLEAVRDQLANAKFVDFLIRRRQQALLAVASSLLGSMTMGRYGFSEDFDVLDRYSGQPRSPQTLSGGESFLASLALALAMVELAGRAGGRLEALFLDEGFGSLDANSLDVAVDTLEARAQAGRLVAVITHVKAVAERIDDVLAVTCTPTGGSDFRFLTPDERSGLLIDDAAGGLDGLLG